MNLKKNKSGFTLLEIIIVVIIVGVLASLALPRFFAMVEYSRVQEAFGALSTVRGAMERYYVTRSTYNGATTGTIDTGDPLAGQANAHFAIAVTAAGANTYTLTATRNTVDGGNAAHTVVVTQNAGTVTRAGTAAFSGVN